MKMQRKVWVRLLCLLTVIVCVLGLTACGQTTCEHEWGDWTTVKTATCTEAGSQERACAKCGEKETSAINALGHSYTAETVKDEALKSAATCTEAAVYYKSCSCGAIGTETFTSGSALDHKDENHDHTCDNGCGKNDMGDHADSATDTDHVCDYGCGAVLESCADAAGDGNHTCDVCGKADVSEHTYGDAACETSAACSECKATTGDPLGHKDVNKDHVCDVCAKSGVSEHTYGAPTCDTPAICSGCGATKGEALGHKDENHDHTCDNGCGKNDMGDHADSATDTDHVCDYGCGAVLENCVDAEDDDDHACDVCEKAGVSTHAYTVTSETEATCDAAATKTYTCNCGDTYNETDGDALGHNISGVTPAERQIEGCEYVLVYTCQRCNEEVTGETVYHHNHVASITTPATCQTDGVKTLTCACGDTKTEVIEKDSTGHAWVKGEASNGTRTDECSICHETKKVTVYEGTTTDSTNASDLKDTEIELNDTNISFDNGVIDTIGDQKVTVSADKLEGDDRTDLGLSGDQLDQVGDSPIYNFTVNNGTDNIAEFGEDNWVTITLPYTLQEGEDVDSIAIWFIGDDGELESIRATYNNGYVTFKTNHFSYYTVTRLTPAERCQLYGHSYFTQHVEGNCLKDEYDLHVCVRCHDRYVDGLIEADGHDYVAETAKATCTQDGQTVYTCADCDHSYTIKLSATGHAWTEVDSKEATCVSDGYTAYKCDNCDEEYTEFTARLAHEYTNTVVAPTCTTGGYTLHECNNCEYSTIDTVVPALGHVYAEGSWVWADDYSSATLTFVCENDEKHVFELKADIEKTVGKGACSDFVKTTYTATVIYDGDVYTDEKSVSEGSPEHKFSSDWKKDDKAHWHECVCGEKTDVSEHTFGNDTVTKQPTCGAEGESTATCACGATKTTAIPATGEHTYVDGFCSVCGEKALCDHTELHRASVDLSAFGACQSILYYRTCECGEVKVLDMERSLLTCTMEEVEEEEYEDENGYEIATGTAICTHCGLKLIQTYTEGSEGCLEFERMDYIFMINDEIVIDNIGFEYSGMEHDEEPVEIDVSQYGGCGGTMIVDQCTLCGEITEFREFHLDCNVDMNEDPVVQEITDENGIVHMIQMKKCPDCGFEIKIDTWDDDASECVYSVHMRVTVSCGETTLVDISQDMFEEEHEYETEYELLGKTCEDIVKLTADCAVCGDHFIAYTREHMNKDYDAEIDLSEYTNCGGTLYGTRCNVCGTVTNFDEWDLKCNMDDGEEEYITDENGEVVEYRCTNTCLDCGLVFIERKWIERESVCEYSMCSEMQICKDGECLFVTKDEWYNSDHEYEYTYEIEEGKTCKDTYTVHQYCPNCGQTSEYRASGHRTEPFETDLSEYGTCGGSVHGYSCSICGEITSFYPNFYCDFADETMIEIIDENGVAHSVWTRVCSDCGLKYVTDTWDVPKEDCYYERYTSKQVYIGDKLLWDCTESNYSSNHQYEYTYELKGESCEDGVTVTSTCQKCGNEYTQDVDWHMTIEKERIDLSELGCVCGGYLILNSCPCGENSSLSLDESLCDFGHEWCESWIENAVEGSQYTTDGWIYFDSEAHLYTCAVTDPTACAYKIRYASYWLKDGDSCIAYRYQTWQLGYDEKTGTCQREITFQTDVAQCHNYVDNSQTDALRYDCADCGSYYCENNYYDENGDLTKYEKIAVNTVSGFTQSRENVDEYENGNLIREYDKTVYADGEEYWSEYLYTYAPYTGTFGENGVNKVTVYTDSYGDRWTEEYAYVYYKGYRYDIHSKTNYGSYWYCYDYTYSFEDGCYRTTVYTNSDGETWTETDECCRYYSHTTIQQPTCTQDGQRGNVCVVCGKQSELETIEPTDHDWVTVNDHWYYCCRCGLENANGASGDIIMEDLTEKYGNGELYVVGYYSVKDIPFSSYVSLILADGTEVVCPEINFTEIEGLRAIAFSKADVEAWATENGYADWDVRFAFVPETAEGSLDYAITFAAATVDSDTITGDVSFTDYVAEGETQTYTITPAEDGTWLFTAFTYNGTYATLYDANGNELVAESYGGEYNYGDFRIVCDLKAGETYTISVRWDYDKDVGAMALMFAPMARK